MGNYSHITWANLKSALAARLHDVGNVYWSDIELGLYLAETLRVWSVLTGFWRDTGQLSTAASTPFYDLTTLTNTGGDALLSYTLKDQDLVTLIQYHLLEPATGSSWTGSEQFILSDLTNSLQKRRDQLIADTGSVVTRTTGIAIAPGVQSKFLSDSIVEIRRLAFIGTAAHPLVPSDIQSQRNFSAIGFFTAGVPYSYSSASTRPTEIILVPPANEPGTLDLIAVQSGAGLDPATGILLGIPDDYAWAVKWGAMADLLAKDGPARDPIRSAYCERRYQLGVELIKIAPVVINVEINGVPLDTDSITSMDAYNPSWQTATGTPDSVSSMRTLIAVAPCPNGVFSLLLDVVAKAPIPTIDTQYVQIGREQLDPILDYAEHLAAFKMGGEEFRSTFKGAESFFKAALGYNERLTSTNSRVLSLMAQSSADIEDRPYRVPGGLGALQGQPVSAGSSTLNASTPEQPSGQEGQ